MINSEQSLNRIKDILLQADSEASAEYLLGIIDEALETITIMGDGSATIAPVSAEPIQPITPASGIASEISVSDEDLLRIIETAIFFESEQHPEPDDFGGQSQAVLNALRHHLRTKKPVSSEICYNEIETTLVRHFQDEVSREYPNATTVPSYEHWRQKANPIIKALRPYLATREPVSVADAAIAVYNTAVPDAKNNRISNPLDVAKAVLDAAGVKYVD